LGVWREEPSLKRLFEYHPDDAGPARLDFEVPAQARLACELDSGTPVVYINKSGSLALAKVLVQLGSSQHATGFHVHLGRDLDPEAPEAIRIVLVE
jgi:hypothetical protein